MEGIPDNKTTIALSEKNREQYVVFCRNIKALRKLHGFNKKEMAVISGISVPILTKIEEGIMPPRISINIIFEISKYFKIKPHKLFSPL